jgi:hypothetical protein
LEHILKQDPDLSLYFETLISGIAVDLICCRIRETAKEYHAAAAAAAATFKKSIGALTTLFNN